MSAVLVIHDAVGQARCRPIPARMEMFSDHGSLGHVLFGALAGASPEPWNLAIAAVFAGYETSKLRTETPERTGGKFLEFGLGLITWAVSMFGELMPYFPKRGVGQANPSSFCTGITGWLCAEGLLNCPACAIQAPTVAQQSPTVPSGGYEGETDVEAGTVPGMNIPYQPIYPDVPGGAGCDWTQVNWTDTSTWCTANWLLVGGAALLGVFALLKGTGALK